MKDYKLEVWLTVVCFILIVIFGGGISSFFVLGVDIFFEAQEAPADFELGDTLYVVKDYVLGFPLHYFLMVVLSWLGVTVVGIIWSLAMDRLEERQKS